MKKSIILIFICINLRVNAQQHYWVFFTDKNGVKFDPLEYFDPKAILRRLQCGYPLDDSTDFPINQNYIKEVTLLADSLTSQTRWFNAVAVIADSQSLAKIRELPFVSHIQPVLMQTYPAGGNDSIFKLMFKGLLKKQTERMQASLFAENGYSGKGIRIAVFDAGFPGVNKMSVFRHLFENNRIIATYDFARKKEYVYAHNKHGTMVLSCITGITNFANIGMATEAEFLLARTEVNSEPFSEEENWLAAAEWADKYGAQIINSSLGYTFQRYFPYEMDGHTSLVARAANLAANKGILVINAMGNDGNKDWKILSTPADADSVLSVGGIDPNLDYHADFSSFGPTADKRLKPEVCAYAHAIVATKQGLTDAYGTSFATPLITGFAACAWQAMSDKTNMQIKCLIMQSADLFPYFDYAHGFGVPQASFFINSNHQKKKDTTFTFEIKGDSLWVNIKDEQWKKHRKEKNYLYIHIEDKNSVIIKYWLIDVGTKRPFAIKLDNWNKHYKVLAFYKGFTNSFIIR